MSGRLEGKLALVTGATRGIGKAIALGFAAEGAHIIAVGRTQGALEELDDEIRALGGQTTLVPMDLSDGNNVDVLGVSVQQRFGKLDILIANAGILGELTPVAHIEPHVWDNVMALNLTANYRLIRIFDPILRAAPAGRAVFVSSSAAQGVRPFWGSYAVSKAGLEAMVRAYAAEVQNSNLKVNLFDPGGTKTGMRAKAYPGEDKDKLPEPEVHVSAMLDLVVDSTTQHGELIVNKQTA
jgi:NAD(P)-dependent dehydrogenase (short-subunit alcohol dehydrogenase family)